ncbi:conserved hypothetical protein [Candidatus Accumulibacter aalborgensis]|uniref:Uncharacterized protein n=1 Tax=Candidatus Accumulibacter aalborgensis TaxID=1860102 RepID=A0A1A8XM29_9PROT|nr:hypothetical protein [Candidatus Accumulibacter aalborgensis]SBT04998.1 conserved hypothetical protein [Candidatus Accumulibacter aalborgensis]
MTTTTPANTNKTALRASLKKEDESLAQRLLATDIPLVAAPEDQAPAAAPASQPGAEQARPRPAAAAPTRKVGASPVAEVAPTPTTTNAPAKAGKKVTAARAGAVRSADPVAAPVAAAQAQPTRRQAVVEAQPVGAQKPAKAQAKSSRVTARDAVGKKSAKAEPVKKIDKAAKQKGDKRKKKG